MHRVAAIGPGRLLYGSDFPFTLPEAQQHYHEVIGDFSA
jgi:predicted TIM-barrel fold metal-dependent hydrolase